MSHAAEPFHARVAGFLERIFNPILLKELRASFRGNRFFIAHLSVLGCFAVGLLIALGVALADAGRSLPDPAEIGREVFLVTQILQLGVVLLVVPGLAATSITVEREGLTHDLLVTTGLLARQIVWGKFSAALVQTFTLLVSMLPLVGLCFLFGGISVGQIVSFYAFLLVLSALLIAFALFVSANSAGTQRAVGTVYAGALLLSIVAGFAWVEGRRTGLLAAFGETAGFAGEFQSSRSAPPDAAEIALYVVALPAYLWSALMALFFIGASNRLKPVFANRSTNLRVYAVVAAALAVTLIAISYHLEFGGGASVREVSEALAAFSIGLLPLVVLLSIFACEDPAPPALLRPSRIPRILRPGAESGTLFTVLLTGGLLAAAFLALLPLTVGFDRGAWSGLPGFLPVTLAFAAVLVWSAFCASLGRLLTIAWPDRPILVRTLLVGVAVFITVAPLVHWGVAQEFRRNALDRQGLLGPWSLLLSPAAAILAALDLSQYRRDFPLLCLGAPIPALYAATTAAAAGLFLALGNRIALRRGFAGKDLKKEKPADAGC